MSLLDAYATIRDRLKSGDLFAYHRHGFFDWLIDVWTHSQFDHVNLVVKLEVAGTKRLFFHNATPETGVSLIPISTYLAQERGKVWWVQLNQAIALEKNPTYQQDILTYVMTTLGKDLEPVRKYDWMGVAKFVFPFLKQRKNEEFCSELAAEDERAGKLLTQTQLSPGQLVSQFFFQPPALLS